MSYVVEDERDIADAGIGLWNEERPEIDTSGKAITGRILRLNEIILDRMNETTQKFGVKYSTYAIIATLRASGPPYRMTPKSLQATLLITSGGLSNLLRRIEEQGYVRRSIDPQDGRGVIVELTPAGFNLSEEAMPVQAETERNMVRMLSEDEQKILVDLLRRMVLVNSMDARR